MAVMARTTISALVMVSLTTFLVEMPGIEASSSSLSTLGQLCDSIQLQVSDCGVEKFVLITGSDVGGGGRPELNTAILGSLSRSEIVFSHYVIDKHTTNNDVIEIIRRHTLDQNVGHTTFLITTPCFDDVINSAVRYSRENVVKQRGQLWFHRTRWMVVTNSLEDVEHFLESQDYIPMDNVAFATIHNHCVDYNIITKRPAVYYNSIRFYTLMWKTNRTRSLEPIPSLDKPKSINVSTHNKCFIFPNLKHHLNGRHLKVITKVHWGFFVYIEYNQISRQSEFQGFLPDVLRTVAASLNFTYTITPYPPALDTQPTWDEVVYNVTSGEVDFSATLWSYSWIDVYNICITYPIVLDTFTGVYRRPIPSDEYMSLYILCPFHSITYLLLFASLVHTLIIYVIIVEVCYENETNTTPRNPFSAERRKSKLYLRRKTSNPNPVHNRHARKKNGDTTFSDRVRVLVWSFSASVLNQAYLPRPKQMSARLLLFLWSISMVMFYAIYTGSLTAEMVNASDNNKLGSFSDLVSGGRFRWGTTNASIIDKVMSNQTEDKTLYKLNVSKQNIPDNADGGVYFTLKDTLETLEDKYVVIHFKTLLTQIIGMMDNPEDYVMIKDSLLSANQGFIWRTDSELALLFSDAFRKMHESGLIDQMYEKYAHGNRSVSPMASMDGETRRKTLTLNNIRWPLIIVSILVSLCVVVLLVEKMWHPVTNMTLPGSGET